MKNNEVKYGWLIGAGVGFVVAGPLGALLGGIFGAQVSSIGGLLQGGSVKPIQPGDALVVLLAFCAEVIKADGVVKGSEIRVVKEFLMRHFGRERASQAMPVFKAIMDGQYDVRAFENSVNNAFDISFKTILIQLLLEIAQADGDFHQKEKAKILSIAEHLGLDPSEIASLIAASPSAQVSDYKVLEVSENASQDDIKKAYRVLIKKYHPDKIAHLGDEFQKEAKLKFERIQEAYDRLTY
jgi:DnaJ like chaperone protein